MSPGRTSTRGSSPATRRATSAMRSSTRATIRRSAWSSSSRCTSRRPMNPGKPVTRAVGTRSGPFEDDDRDLAVGLLLVLVVVGPDLGHEAPQALALFALGDVVAHPEAVAPDLHLDL